MVVSDEALASEAGVEILRQGGNAVDAAVAVSFALAVVHPQAGNIGGGGFMLIRMADGRAEVVDYRETGPAGAQPDMYLDTQGRLIEDSSTVGHRAVAVPGSVAGLELAHRRWGKLKWAQVLAPAARLAEEGYRVSHSAAASLRDAGELLARYPESKRIFLREDRPYQEGESFRQPELARTLRRIARRGAKDFYHGETAKLIVAEMRRGGGLITGHDLARYRAKGRGPLRATYQIGGHQWEVLACPPPSSGVILLEILNQLEKVDLEHLGADSPEAIHWIVEASRRAFADRARFLADPDFAVIPVQGLMSKEYAAAMLGTIDASRATSSDLLRMPDPVAYVAQAQPVPKQAALYPIHSLPAVAGGTHTTHFSVVDAAGNAVATTTTINDSFGSGVTVTGAGFLLNNEMDDFTVQPGAPNALFELIQSPANAPGPSKRPLSSMTPTIVLEDGRLRLVLGSPGGPRIISATVQVLLNVMRFGRNIEDAVAAPRFHHQWKPDQLVVEASFPASLRERLTAMGHGIKERKNIGAVQAIAVNPLTGERQAGADSRLGGEARTTD
jgi:gamma-glutamyltranspeptidase/glutathione hydrolase